MTARERSDGRRGAADAPAPPADEQDTVGPGAGTTGAGGAADPAEPAGDQDPAVEAERTEETDRLRPLDPEPAPGPEDAPAATDDGTAAGEPGGPADGGETAAEPLARVEAERDEYLAMAQRAQADFDNYRKRAAREAAVAGTRAKAEVVRSMLPAVDSLERALHSLGDADSSLAEGVRLVHSELVGALERNGVASIEPAGEPFDPNLHEALSTRSENGAEPGVVLDVVQKGYRLNGTVLRPARVVVAA